MLVVARCWCDFGNDMVVVVAVLVVIIYMLIVTQCDQARFNVIGCDQVCVNCGRL